MKDNIAARRVHCIEECCGCAQAGNVCADACLAERWLSNCTSVFVSISIERIFIPDSPDDLAASQHLRRIYIWFQRLDKFRLKEVSRGVGESRNPHFSQVSRLFGGIASVQSGESGFIWRPVSGITPYWLEHRSAASNAWDLRRNLPGLYRGMRAPRRTAQTP